MPEKPRKHTPIVSEKQRGLFGAELARKRAGKETKTGMSEETLGEHLEESKGKDLPKKVEKSKNICPKCGGKLIDREFQSMGPGYSEWEHHSQGAPIPHCPKCKKDYEYNMYGKIEKSLSDKINNFLEKQETGYHYHKRSGETVFTQPHLTDKSTHSHPGEPGKEHIHPGSWGERYRPHPPVVKSLLNKAEDKDMKEIKRDNTQREKQLAENISSNATGEQIRKQKMSRRIGTFKPGDELAFASHHNQNLRTHSIDYQGPAKRYRGTGDFHYGIEFTPEPYVMSYKKKVSPLVKSIDNAIKNIEKGKKDAFESMKGQLAREKSEGFLNNYPKVPKKVINAAEKIVSEKQKEVNQKLKDASVSKSIDEFIKAYPQVCPSCKAKIYGVYKPIKCPKCKEPWKEPEIKKQVKEPFAVATETAKRMGYSDFSEGSEGATKRDEIAEALAGRKKMAKSCEECKWAHPDLCRICPSRVSIKEPIKAPQEVAKSIDNFIEKKYGEFRSVSEGTPVEQVVEAGKVKPEETDWRSFVGGRAVTRPGSPTPKGTYHVGPRGGTSRHTGEPWRPISFRGGAHYTKSMKNLSDPKVREKVDQEIEYEDAYTDTSGKPLSQAERDKVKIKPVTKSIDEFIEKQGPPGPPPRLGLQWSPQTRRWIKPQQPITRVSQKIHPAANGFISELGGDYSQHGSFGELMQDFRTWLTEDTGKKHLKTGEGIDKIISQSGPALKQSWNKFNRGTM